MHPSKPSSTDRIVKTVEIRATPARVWRALTDYREFSEWFRVKIESPFVAGKRVSGRVTFPGYEHVTFELLVERMEPERLFSYRWHPHAVDMSKDYSSEPSTLVEFTLEKTATGTLLTVVESGFDQVPIGRRDEAFRANSGGWEQQMANIQKFVHEH